MSAACSTGSPSCEPKKGMRENVHTYVSDPWGPEISYRLGPGPVIGLRAFSEGGSTILRTNS
jgi:hypothetical protein